MNAMDFSPRVRSKSSKSISFLTLPLLCQVRFVQLCPARILHKFSCANTCSQKLTTERRIIYSVNIDIEKCCFLDFRVYNPGHYNRKIVTKELKNERYEVIEAVEIKYTFSIYHTLQAFNPNMPAADMRIKREQILKLNEFLLFTELNLETKKIDFDALILLSKQPLKKFTFKGGINFICSYMDYKNGLDKIAKIEWVRFTIILNACSYTNTTADEIIVFLIDNVKGFTQHYYGENEINYNNLTRKEAILQCCNLNTTV